MTSKQSQQTQKNNNDPVNFSANGWQPYCPDHFTTSYGKCYTSYDQAHSAALAHDNAKHNIKKTAGTRNGSCMIPTGDFGDGD